MENRVYQSTDFLNNLLYDATKANPNFNLLKRNRFYQGWLQTGIVTANTHGVVDSNFYFLPAGTYTISYDFDKGTARQSAVARYSAPDESAFIDYIGGGWVSNQPRTFVNDYDCYVRVTLRINSNTTLYRSNLKYIMLLSGDNTIFEITRQPSDFIGNAGDTAYFVISAIGVTTYQWQFSNDQGVTWYDASSYGFDTTLYAPPITQSRYGNLYRCKITNGDGQTAYSRVCKMIQPK